MYALAEASRLPFAAAIALGLGLPACGEASGSSGAAGSANFAGSVSSGGSGGSEVTPVTTAGGSKASAGSVNSGSGGSTEVSGPAAVDCTHDGDGKTTLAFVNACSKAVTFRGSDQVGGSLAPGAFSCVDIGSDVEALSAKRYWGFSGEDPGAGRHSLAEFTFNTDFNDFDWYNISHVDAFNLSLQIVPLARPKCDVLTCAEEWLSQCPAVGQYKQPSGAVVACVSPERDNPDSEVARLFEGCDDGYAWSGDDQKGSDPSPVRACAGEDWQIVFCPAAAP